MSKTTVVVLAGARLTSQRMKEWTKEQIVDYYSARIQRLYQRNETLKVRERKQALKDGSERERHHRLRLGLSLKPALDPKMRGRLDAIDKQLGFS